MKLLILIIGFLLPGSPAFSQGFDIQHFSDKELPLLGAQCTLSDEVGILIKAKWSGLNDRLWIKVNGEHIEFEGTFELVGDRWHQSFTSNDTTVTVRLKRIASQGERNTFTGTIRIDHLGQTRKLKVEGYCAA